MSDPTPDQLRMQRAQEIQGMIQRRQQAHGGIADAQSLAIRARQQVINEEIAQQRFDVQQANLELDRVKQLADLEKERALVKAQLQQQNQVSTAIGKLGELNPNSEDYQLKMTQIFHDNPLASKDEVVQQLVRNHLQARQIVDETGAHIAQQKAEQDAIQARIIAQRDDIAKRGEKLTTAPTGMNETSRRVDSSGNVVQTFAPLIPQDVKVKMETLKGRIADYENRLNALEPDADKSERAKIEGQIIGDRTALEGLSSVLSAQPTPATATPSGDDEAALQWAKDNPDDPRAAQIIQANQ